MDQARADPRAAPHRRATRWLLRGVDVFFQSVTAAYGTFHVSTLGYARIE